MPDRLNRHDLSDEEWERLRVFLPSGPQQRGGRWADHRTVINGVFFRAWAGCPWRDPPGGTPHEGESLTACARRELLEETGISANPSKVALVVESVRPESGRRMLDVVFLADEPPLGRERSGEPGLEPHFVPPGQLAGMDLHPALAGHLYRLIDPGPHGYAPYVGGSWRQRATPGPNSEP
jgi:ADP-ribose pyrophosphatase YjhB (NUDIX family)